MKEIKVGEYVRTILGIAKIIKIENELYIFDQLDEELQSGDLPNIMFQCDIENNILKHSKNILDLIEVGDILKLKDGEKWEVQEHQGDGNWIQTEWEVIENEEDLKNKVDSIVTKEQFNQVKYEV